jgi:hypothetical protein
VELIPKATVISTSAATKMKTGEKMASGPEKGSGGLCQFRKTMSLPSSNNDIHEPVSASFTGNEDDPSNSNQDGYWLTLRRRCELCKQRKVRDYFRTLFSL